MGGLVNPWLPSHNHLCVSQLEEKIGRGLRPKPCAWQFTWKREAKGVRTGSMDTSMRLIADHYEQETDRRLHHAISVVEPTLIILLSLIVGQLTAEAK